MGAKRRTGQKSMLGIKSNKAYTLDVSKMDTECIQNGYIGKVSIDKDSKDKDSKEENAIEEKAKRFYPPTLDEVKQYCEERKNNIDPMAFIDFYSSKGWMIGKNRMKDWKAAVRTWDGKEKNNPKQKAAYMTNGGMPSDKRGNNRASYDDASSIPELQATG